MTQQAQLPDGTILEFPDDASPDVIQRVVKQHLGIPSAQRGSDIGYEQFAGDTRATPQGDTIRGIPNSPVDKILGTLGNYADNAMFGGADEALAGIYAAGAMVPGGRSPGGAFNEELARLEQKRRDFNSVNSGLGQAADVAGMVGNPTNVMGGEFIASAPTLPAKIARSAGLGGTIGGASGVLSTEGDANQRLKGGVYGAGIGTLAGAAAGPLTSAVSPKLSPEVKLLMEKGVTPTLGQMAGSALQKVEQKATSVPILGDFIRSAHQRGLEDFNRAVFNDVLDPIGQSAGKDVGREGIQALETALSDNYQRILPNVHFQADPQFSQDISTLSQMAAAMPPEQATQFQNILRNKVVSQFSQTGHMDGQTFKGVEAELSKDVRGLKSDPSFYNRQLGDAVGEIVTAMRTNLERNNPMYAPELKKANAGWARYVRVRDAASRIGAEDGVFTPEQFQSAVRSQDKSVGKGNFAKGDALMQELSEAGKKVLGKKYPDSGTAGRIAQGVLTGGGLAYLSPETLATVGLLSAPYTRIGQKAVAGLLTSHPKMRGEIRRVLEFMSPALGTASGQAGGLLSQP